jgi:hypothetical protein
MDDFVDRFYDATGISLSFSRGSLVEAFFEMEMKRAHKLAFQEAIEVVSSQARERTEQAAACHSDRSRKHMHLRADEAGQIVALLKAKGDD